MVLLEAMLFNVTCHFMFITTKKEKRKKIEGLLFSNVNMK